MPVKKFDPWTSKKHKHKVTAQRKRKPGNEGNITKQYLSKTQNIKFNEIKTKMPIYHVFKQNNWYLELPEVWYASIT